MTANLDGLFAALADPTRRAVVERLMTGPAPVSDLHAPHDMALPTFLKHLGRLEAAGLVRSRKIGRVRMVEIEAEGLAGAEDWLRRTQALWQGRLDRLAALAARQEEDENDGLPDGRAGT